MSRHLAVLTVCIFCMAADLSAQLGTASPYSMYGLGEINELTSGRLAGKGGSAIKKLGMQSRADIEEFTGKKIFLELYVKVDKDWRDNEQELKRFGYEA